MWSPYIVGAFIGILVCASLYFSKQPVGASSAYASLAGLIGKLVAPRHTSHLDYFKKNPPEFNWEFVFVLSIIMGAFVSAVTSGDFKLEWYPQMWTETFGQHNNIYYALLAFLGGILMSFGARMAGGCTSGHGISGTIQLSVASWISLICFFAGGVLAIRLIY